MKAKKLADEPVASAKRWAAAIAAPLHEISGLSLDALGGYESTSTCGSTSARADLHEKAGISSRREAFEKLEAFFDAGLHVAHEKALAWREALPREATAMSYRTLEPFTLQARMFVCDRASELPSSSPRVANTPLALDMARLVYYVGLAQHAAFLSSTEAWRFVVRATTKVRAAYGSWADFAAGYAYGRWFATGYVDDEVRAMETLVQKLLVKGPWSKLPWDLDLSPLDQLAHSPELPEQAASSLLPLRVRPTVTCPECLLPALISSPTEGSCQACGSSLKGILGHVWATATALGDRVDDQESEADGAQEDDVRHLRNSGDDIEVVAYRRSAPVCLCGSPIDDELIHASVARAHVVCACGRKIPLVAAPPSIRAADFRALYVLGGPLSVGEPNGWITLLFGQAP